MPAGPLGPLTPLEFRCPKRAALSGFLCLSFPHGICCARPVWSSHVTAITARPHPPCYSLNRLSEKSGGFLPLSSEWVAPPPPP